MVPIGPARLIMVQEPERFIHPGAHEEFRPGAPFFRCELNMLPIALYKHSPFRWREQASWPQPLCSHVVKQQGGNREIVRTWDAAGVVGIHQHG